jgi:hypothetical protein
MFARRHILEFVERRLTSIIFTAVETIRRKLAGCARGFHIVAETTPVSVDDIFLLSFFLNQIHKF